MDKEGEDKMIYILNLLDFSQTNMRKCLGLLSVLAVSAALAGCGGGSDGSTTTTATTAVETTTSETTTSETTSEITTNETTTALETTTAETTSMEETSADATSETQSEADSSQEETSAEDESTTMEDTSKDAEDTKQGSEDTTTGDSAANDGKDADVSQAIEGSKTSEEKPAALGQWVKFAIYSTEDNNYHDVDVRITKVTTKSEDKNYIKEALNLNNKNSYDYNQIKEKDLNLPDDVELCVLDYEVSIPKDFPASDLGVTSIDVSFSAGAIGGGGIPTADGKSTYIGLASTMEELALEEEPTYEPGKTYSVRALFPMVKGYTDYVFDANTYPDGTDSEKTNGDMLIYVYFDHK